MQVNNPVNPGFTNPMAAKINQWLSPVEKMGNTINTGMATAMGGDTYTSTTPITPAQVQKVPLYQFFNDYNRPPNPLDLKIARRLSMVGINDSQSFLNKADTPFKRTLISYLAGGMFLSSQDRQYVNYQISAWAGQADLMRTGVDLQTARLMQVSGAGDVPSLTRYSGMGGLDKGILFAAMAANALQYGYWMPPFGTVTSAIEHAKQLPPQIRW